MIEKQAVASQVLRNCRISDSRHAGLYSICGLAMRLRDLYKWEKGLDPWIEKDSSEIIDWIGEQEEAWESLAEEDFHEICISGREYDPFDVAGINRALEPEGLLYGAGYVHSMKPSFFLAVLEGKKVIEGITVFILGSELARDLLTMPALSRDDAILIRKDSGRLFFWDQLFFINKSGQKALKFALKSYGLDAQDADDLHRNLSRIFASEMERYIYHELGELKDKVFNRDVWREILNAFPHTPIELLTRAVKDLLADTNEYGTLRHIARERQGASLAFHVAFLNGLGKELFPELGEVFVEFAETGSWEAVERAISLGFNRARTYADQISLIFQDGKENHDLKWIERKIGRELLGPLGLCKEDSDLSAQP